jgi:heme/copper-type cytochrome/quinol oxidase subunit 1
VATILNLRTKGMKMTRLPLTMWAILITAVMGCSQLPGAVERGPAAAHGPLAWVPAST